MQRIAQAVDQRRFWPDHYQADVVPSAKGDNRSVIGDIQINKFGFFGDAGVAGRGEQCIA